MVVYPSLQHWRKQTTHQKFEMLYIIRGVGGGVRLFVDSTTFVLPTYNLQKMEQNLHIYINS